MVKNLLPAEIRSIALWYELQKKGLNIATVDTGDVAYTTGSTFPTGRAYTSIPSPIGFAMEIWGYTYKVYNNPHLVLAGASGSVIEGADIQGILTYTQPEPPATDNTTDASLGGNLGFRNVLGEFVVDSHASNAQGGTVTGDTMDAYVLHTGWVIYDKPLRIVLSQLESYIVGANVDSAGDALARWEVFYKFVNVTPAEYDQLTALATGQAVLEQVIIP